MSLLIARGCWAGAFVIVLASFFLTLTIMWPFTLFLTGLAGLALIRLTRGPINTLLLIGLLGVIFLGAVEQVWTVNLIVSMILGLCGFHLTAFAKRYQFATQTNPQFEIDHLSHVGLISLGAFILSLIGLTIQLDLGFWPVLGLGIFLLITLVMVVRKAQTPPAD